ncbi:MAG: helix-turn-helix domain-containing protein [Alphaproteobacteria bacterium]|nr:helix-turn-helix domain-containing protein [Alphaproteobacteria bacterium]
MSEEEQTEPKKELGVSREYFHTDQAAEYLGMSRQFLEIARHRGDGSGPPFIKLTRAVRYKKSELDDWMAARREVG